MVRQVLHEHAASLSAAGHANRSRRLIKCAKDSGHYHPTEIVRKNNQRVIEQARKYVWGTTNSQLAFIKKHFGRASDRVLITDEQRQEAIDAAQGKLSSSAQGRETHHRASPGL